MTQLAKLSPRRSGETAVASRVLRVICASIALTCIASPRSAESQASVTLNWTKPTTNTDGTPLVDLAGYRVSSGCSLVGVFDRPPIVVPNPAALTYVVEELPSSSTCYFALTAYNAGGVESVLSNPVTRVTDAGPPPAPPANPTQAPMITWSVTPTTPQLLGTPVFYGLSGRTPSAQSITVPPGATAMVLLWSGWNTNGTMQLQSATLGGRALTIGAQRVGTQQATPTGTAYIANPTSGALQWAWTQTSEEGPLVYVAFTTGAVAGSNTANWATANGSGTVDLGAGLTLALIQTYNTAVVTTYTPLRRDNYRAEYGALITRTNAAVQHSGQYGSIAAVVVR